jgi:small-conductance mechanosensitive channel
MISVIAPALKNLEGMATSVVAEVPKVVVGLLLFWVSTALARLVRNWARDLVLRAVHKEDAALVLGQLAYGLGIAAGVLSSAAVMGVSLSHVLAGIGVSGVVVGFAFKDILENYLAGILIMLARPFHPGDLIRTTDFEGRVRTISTRNVVIETLDGQQVVVPSARIYSSPLVNLTALRNRRGSIALRIPLEHDIEAARKGLLDLARHNGQVLAEPAAEVLVTNLEATGVALEFRYWTLGADAQQVRSDLLERIKPMLYDMTPPPVTSA